MVKFDKKKIQQPMNFEIEKNLIILLPIKTQMQPKPTTDNLSGN